MPNANESKAPELSVADMEKYGITATAVDRFHYRKYRYTNLADAVAQAQRDLVVKR